jgi:hypothetical protein
VENEFDDLPNWLFCVEEISAGLYNLKGKHKSSGANVNLTGHHLDDLLREARRVALDMDAKREAIS